MSAWVRQHADALVKRAKRRSGQILLFFFIGWIITFLVIAVWHKEFFNYGTLYSAFVAWAGELLFFTVVGLAVAVISIEEPQDPRTKSWHERVQILFGTHDVPEAVTEYHKKTLESISRFSKSGLRRISITEFDQVKNAYKVSIHHRYEIQSAISDLALEETIPFRIAPDPFDPAVCPEIGQLISLKVNEAETVTSYTAVPHEGLTTQFNVKLTPGGSVPIDIQYAIWMKCGCPQTLRAFRLVESFEVEFVSRLPFNPIVDVVDEPRAPFTLLLNQPLRLSRRAIEPQSIILQFCLQEPPQALANANQSMPNVVVGGLGN